MKVLVYLGFIYFYFSIIAHAAQDPSITDRYIAIAGEIVLLSYPDRAVMARIAAEIGHPWQVIVAPDGQPWVVGKMPVKEFAPNQWHDYRVLVRGNHHQHWIDGHKTADLIDLDTKGRALEGVLAVQVHVGPAMEVQYKDFRIKHLPDDLPLQQAEDHPIPADVKERRGDVSAPAQG